MEIGFVIVDGAVILPFDLRLYRRPSACENHKIGSAVWVALYSREVVDDLLLRDMLLLTEELDT
jgi:hypothetical protein